MTTSSERTHIPAPLTPEEHVTDCAHQGDTLRELSVVKVLLMRETGTVFLARRASARRRHEWEPVGGDAQPGESVFDTARRETEEEVQVSLGGLALSAVAPATFYLDQVRPDPDAGEDSTDRHPFCVRHTLVVAKIDGAHATKIQLNPDRHDMHGWFTLDKAARLTQGTPYEGALQAAAELGQAGLAAFLHEAVTRPPEPLA